MRDIIFSSIVGLHNCGLAKEGDIKEIRKFSLPSFEDLFDNTIALDKKEENGLSEIIYDIRKLPSMIANPNLAIFDVLYSKEIIVADSIPYKRYIQYLLSNRDFFVHMNLRKLYNTIMGNIFRQSNRINQKTEINKVMFEAKGYDPEPMFQIYRMFNMLNGFHKNYDIGKTINLEEPEVNTFAKRIINGEFSKKQIYNLLGAINADVAKMKDFFYEKKYDESLANELMQTTEDMVKICFTRKMLDEILFGEEKGVTEYAN